MLVSLAQHEMVSICDLDACEAWPGAMEHTGLFLEHDGQKLYVISCRPNGDVLCWCFGETAPQCNGVESVGHLGEMPCSAGTAVSGSEGVRCHFVQEGVMGTQELSFPAVTIVVQPSCTDHVARLTRSTPTLGAQVRRTCVAKHGGTYVSKLPQRRKQVREGRERAAVCGEH